MARPGASTKCSDFFGKSVVDRTIQWEDELEKKDPNMDTKTRMINKRNKLAAAGLLQGAGGLRHQTQLMFTN